VQVRDRGWLGVPQNFACGEGWGFRLLTAFAAEWWDPPEGTGEMGGEGKESGNGTPHPAAHLPFFLPACGAPFRETRQR